jgi:hypothetical protein
MRRHAPRAYYIDCRQRIPPGWLFCRSCLLAHPRLPGLQERMNA